MSENTSITLPLKLAQCLGEIDEAAQTLRRPSSEGTPTRSGGGDRPGRGAGPPAADSLGDGNPFKGIRHVADPRRRTAKR